MEMKTRKAAGALAFALAVALFGAPSSPVVDAVPTVGGEALAYGPCTNEYLVMQGAQAAYDLASYLPGNSGLASWLYDQASRVYQEAVADYLGCAYG